MGPAANPRQRSSILIGSWVEIVQKEDQRSGRSVSGTVREILTNSATHPRGIKVRLTDGRVGRVNKIIRNDQGSTGRDEPSSGKT